MLASIEAEVAGQGSLLAKLNRRRMPELPSGSLFVGAGDSYIAAVAAAILSGYRHLACDPYFLISSPSLAEGRTVVFISVSGRTKSNVAAARKVAGIARRTIALTSNPDAALANATDDRIRIPYKYVPRMPGTLSFTLSLLATLKLAGLNFSADFAGLLSKAGSRAARLQFSERGTTFFLGNRGSYASSQYAGAKLYEFFGDRAQAQQLEEFSHMELFSLRKEDTVNIFASSDPSGMGKKLAESLRSRGFDADVVNSEGKDEVGQLFYEVFLVQSAAIGMMRKRRLKGPKFIDSKASLAVSDSMIY